MDAATRKIVGLIGLALSAALLLPGTITGDSGVGRPVAAAIAAVGFGYLALTSRADAPD